ncbi:hypothetical protein AB835_03565 [Candidatus Endobugula sertula]|uniref:DNA replication and repair protein RecF n=1 Tax=Candidatus Endobugula sertula TaxID=62101 RepID=A0A1D2QS24_9GAMM|nr:hypothetical protein AB835_03565 [Candidatus Endobugula sertula]
MTVLNRLIIKGLRNVHNATSIELSPKINFFYGNNGSGKTSILEAVSLLGLGRSFRSHKTLSLVNYSIDELIIFADIAIKENMVVPVGFQKHRNGRNIIRIAGESVHSAAVLAKQLPLQFINANSFQLIEGSPSQRRQFLDWVVFHVKPEFSNRWKALQKLLKQRNSLLRHDKINYSDLSPWDIEFCRLAEEIHHLRTETFKLFSEVFLGLDTDFAIDNLAITMEYTQGWNVDKSLSDCLKENFERDKRDGYTHHGPQRADIKIKAKGKPAAEVLSRGQKKALICAMHIAQAYLYQQETQQKCVFLVDDLLAELDKRHSIRLAAWLTELGGQVFVTGISEKEMQDAWAEQKTKTALFHVKQGSVEQIHTANKLTEKP